MAPYDLYKYPYVSTYSNWPPRFPDVKHVFLFQKKSKTQLLFSIFRLRAFFETLPNDKQPGFLCPDYAGFLGITEKHFYESLSSVLDTNVDCRYCRG